MTRALVYKEFREALPMALLGLAVLLVLGGTSTTNSPTSNPLRNLLNDRPDAIPFVSDAFTSRLTIVASVFAMALGFWQTLGDFHRDAQLFLLHRPVTSRRMYGVKLAMGVCVYLLCTGLAIVVYAIWAATPGNHASPFDWSMTLPAWRTWLSVTCLYLAAALCGIYPAAWLGTRLAPLAAVGGIYFICSALPIPTSVGLTVLIAIDIALTISILHVVRTRDFA
jgi:hypothetical protein